MKTLLLVLGLQAALSAAITSVAAIGHEYREDDSPSIAAAPDGSLWAAWLSFSGDRDDIAIRRQRSGKWENLQWVPATSGDNWAPQVAVDSANRVWVVWSQQAKGNWDIYARRFDPDKQQWGDMERLTSDAQPDINPRLSSDGKGHFALAWQGFRNGHSNIFVKTFDGEKWSQEIRVTNRAANDWEPAIAFDRSGAVWVAYDSYKNGNYDVFLSRVASGEEIPVATSPRFEARASIAVDTANRIWVAYESGAVNWGKDQGWVIRDRQPGASPGGDREVRVRCYDSGKWREPAVPSFKSPAAYLPNVFSDGQGSVWLMVKPEFRLQMAVNPASTTKRTYYHWEYWYTHLDAGGWSEAQALPTSNGRISTRMSATLAADGSLWVAWPTDHRNERLFHRPHRQQVWAARLPAATPVSTMATGPGPDAGPAPKPGHADETGDLAAIRAYTVKIDGAANHIVRGDFHRHTELSWDAGGGQDGSLQDFYRYMIDAAQMDFGASTDHQGGAWPYWWWYTQKMTDMYHIPGAYTSIFGYERSAFFPFGHRNVFFANRSEARVTPFFMKGGMKEFSLPRTNPLGDEPGVASVDLVANDTRLLYEEVRPRNGVIIAHTTATNQGTNWSDNDPNLEPVVEIFQGARASSEQKGAPHSYDGVSKGGLVEGVGYQPAGYLSNAWAKGYKLGIISSSDHFSTHISYAMVYTADTSRQGILDAIRKRHTYGAMDNIILDVHMGRHFMGDEFTLSKTEPMRVKVRGTRKIAKVVVIKDSTVIYTTEPGKQDVQFDFRDTGDAKGRHYYYVRAQQDDDMLAWSSPMFVNY